MPKTAKQLENTILAEEVEMLSLYPACFVKEKTGYTVIFPDWDNAATCGSTFEEAMSMAVDLLAGLMFDKKLEGAKLPKATPIGKIKIDDVASFAECKAKQITVNIVSVDADLYAKTHFEKCVKKTVTILEWQNIEGMKRGINFSKVFQDALTKVLLEMTQA